VPAKMTALLSAVLMAACVVHVASMQAIALAVETLCYVHSANFSLGCFGT
jgi:hypothetical protein